MSDARAMTAEEFDRVFDEGDEDVLGYAVLSTVRPARDASEEVRKVNCSLPAWVVDEAEREARRLAVTRSAVINLWLADAAESCRTKRLARA